MGSLLQDFRYGCRMFLNNPGFTAVAVLTLALGIGASTTVFSWIDNVLLHPFPGVAKASELVAFETVTPDGQFVSNSYLDFRDYRDKPENHFRPGHVPPHGSECGRRRTH